MSRDKAGYVLVSSALVVCLVLVAARGLVLLAQGTPVAVGLGAAALVLPLIGAWFLWRTTRFAQQAGHLARLLDAEGGLPVDELRRTPSGRIDRDCADAVFRARRRETEQAPQDWRCWFRLAVAYRDCGDTPRARRAMQRAIALHRAATRPAGTDPPSRPRRRGGEATGGAPS